MNNTTDQQQAFSSSALFGGWVAVEKKLPPVGERVLAFGLNVYCKEKDIYEAMWLDNEGWRTPATYSAAPDENVELENVTHWTPFPPLPHQ
jgi:hypothetical protein